MIANDNMFDRYWELCSLTGRLWRHFWMATRDGDAYRARRLRNLITRVEYRLVVEGRIAA